MAVIALCCANERNTRLLETHLARAGHQPVTLTAPGGSARADLVILRPAGRAPDWARQAARGAWLEQVALGARSVNSLAAWMIANDKLAASAAFAAVGLLVPPSGPCHPGAPAPDWHRDGQPLIVKPVAGTQGKGIAVVDEWRFALAHASKLGAVCQAQQLIRDARTVRVVATPGGWVCAWSKTPGPGGGPVASASQGGRRHPETPSAAMQAAACGMVAAVGGDLMGCDLLETADGRVWAIEANPGFIVARDQPRAAPAVAREIARLTGG